MTASTDVVRTQIVVPTASAMQEIGRRLAALLRAGDLVVLTGSLGAGKTTLAQGIGAGLGVRGGVTSPTFVIARVHPSLVGGPSLVHADAYRLGGRLEVDDLDLDASVAESVTLVEWGEGLVEELADDRLEIEIGRSEGTDAASVDSGAAEPDDVRLVQITGRGDRWRGVELAGLAAPDPGAATV